MAISTVRLSLWQALFLAGFPSLAGALSLVTVVAVVVVVVMIGQTLG